MFDFKANRRIAVPELKDRVGQRGRGASEACDVQSRAVMRKRQGSDPE